MINICRHCGKRLRGEHWLNTLLWKHIYPDGEFIPVRILRCDKGEPVTPGIIVVRLEEEI